MNAIYNENNVCINYKKIEYRSKEFEYTIKWCKDGERYLYALSYSLRYGSMSGHSSPLWKGQKDWLSDLNSCLIEAHIRMLEAMNRYEFAKDSKLNKVRDHIKEELNKLKFGTVQQLELFS